MVLLALGVHLGRDFEPIPGPIPEQVGNLRRWPNFQLPNRV